MPSPPAPLARATARGWRHPVVLGAAGAALLVFGVLLGVGIVRYTEPDSMAAPPPPVAAAPDAPVTGGPPRAIPPDVMRGMLQAARGSLSERRYSEAIAAYQAVLKRDPKNLDAMTHSTHLAIGGTPTTRWRRSTSAPSTPIPARAAYRGQILYEAKKDVAGAVRAGSGS